MNFRDRADCRTRALARRLLLDANRWRKTTDSLDLWLLKGSQELPGVARKTLDIPPLALRVEGIHGNELLPEPLGPLHTVILSRGISTSTLLRLC